MPLQTYRYNYYQTTTSQSHYYSDDHPYKNVTDSAIVYPVQPASVLTQSTTRQNPTIMHVSRASSWSKLPNLSQSLRTLFGKKSIQTKSEKKDALPLLCGSLKKLTEMLKAL
jgi:hypothetical protein